MSDPGARVRRDEPVRVLFVDHAPALGGAEHSLLLLLRCLDRARVTPLLACVPGALQERAQAAGVRCLTLPLPRVRRHPLGLVRLWRGALGLARMARRERAQVLCANTVRSSLYAGLATVLVRRPLVWYVRDILASGWYTRAMQRIASAMVAVSEAVAAPLASGALVVPNGVLLDGFVADAAAVAQMRARWGVPADAPVVGMAGRLRPWKGQDHFLRAMRLVAEHVPDARFVVVGGTVFESSEPYLPKLKDLVASLGIEGRVVFAGHQDDMPAAYAAMDIVVHCSVEPEPFGRVVIEAMAAARPLVAYGWGGPREIVVPGETGLLVTPRDHEALAQATLELLRDPERCRAMGAAGRARAVAHYDARVVARRIEAVLLEVARQRGIHR